MSLLNDNDLDRLSREAADQYDVEPSTSGWETLEKRLDAELPQSRRRRGLLLWWLLAGLLLSGGAWWGTRSWMERKENNGIVKKENELTVNNKRNQPGENENNGTLFPAPTKEQAPQNSTGTRPAGSPLDPVYRKPAGSAGRDRSGKDPVKERNLFADQPDASLRSGPLHPAGNKSNSARATGNPTNPSSIPYIRPKQDLPENIETVTSSNPVHASSIQNAPDVPGIKPTPQTSITDSTQQPATDNATQTTTKKTKPLNLSSRKGSFHLTALAGLDFSNVRFSSAGRTGFNGGLQIGYYITGRLSVNTGLIYNIKNYKARGKDFTPKGPMVYYDIDKIEGGCSMIDIPLNIRYDLSLKPRSRYFISAGLSSYLMDKEDYDYYYYNNAGNYSERNWKTNENSSYLFSILNFSAGFEKQLGNRLQWQVEPYLKLPVKGVGHGEINLNSFGINLGIKYPFGKTGKR